MDENTKPNEQDSKQETVPVTPPQEFQSAPSATERGDDNPAGTPPPTTPPAGTPSPAQEQPPQPMGMPQSGQQTGANIPQSPTGGDDEPKKGNKSFFIVLAVVLLLTIVAVFLIMLNRGNATTEQPTVIPTLEPLPTTEPTSSLSPEEQEVESIDLENPAPTDLAPVESDLEEL